MALHGHSELRFRLEQLRVFGVYYSKERNVIVLSAAISQPYSMVDRKQIMQKIKLSQCMRFPTMWYSTSVDSDESLQPPFKLETPNGVQSVA